MRHVGQILFQHQRLIVAVPAAQDRYPQFESAIEPCNVFDARRLAGAADGEIADADDRDRNLLAVQPAAVIQQIANADGGTVRESGQAQTSTL